MVKENILKIRQRIASVCSKINRDPDSITIVAASKGRDPQQIKEAIEAGIIDIGENRIQEALEKYKATGAARYAQRIKWHMIGHLQTNKVKEALNLFSLIQSVDSLRLAREIDKHAVRVNKIQDILVEVNISGEPTKFGLKPDAATGVIKEMAGLKNINIKGLMTIAPLVDNPEKARPYFRHLRELRDELNARLMTHDALRILSMGMSDDFEAAIEEGSNMIRLGRVIFADA